MTLEEYINRNYSSVLARLQFERYQASLPLDEVFIPGNMFWPITNGYDGSGCNGPLLSLLEKERKDIWPKCHILKGNSTNRYGVDQREWFKQLAWCPKFISEDEGQVKLWKKFLTLIYKDEISHLRGWHRLEDEPLRWMNLRGY